MRKITACILSVFCLFALFSCNQQNNDGGETGDPNGNMQLAQIMYNGEIYYYADIGFDDSLPSGYVFVGSVVSVDNANEPTENLHGALVTKGQKVYANESVANSIFVEYESGYARFDKPTAY